MNCKEKNIGFRIILANLARCSIEIRNDPPYSFHTRDPPALHRPVIDADEG
jgi:hypothetical protein